MKNKLLAALVLFLALILAGLVFVAGSLGAQNETPETDPSGTEGSTLPLQTDNTEQSQTSDPTQTDPPAPTQTDPPEPTQTDPPAPTQTDPPEPQDADFVRVADYIPDIVVDLKYAGTDNFTGQQIYEFSDVYLRYGTVKKLMTVQKTLRQQGLGLKIWDGFRPPAAQFKLWDICPDPTYVANPNNGFSSHSRGNTVDITLVDSEGKELEMPTGFDDFSALADRDYGDCTAQAAANAQLLQEIMTDAGFSAYWGEWWHYSDTVRYDVEMDFIPQT